MPGDLGVCCDLIFFSERDLCTMVRAADLNTAKLCISDRGDFQGTASIAALSDPWSSGQRWTVLEADPCCWELFHSVSSISYELRRHTSRPNENGDALEKDWQNQSTAVDTREPTVLSPNDGRILVSRAAK